MTNIILCGGSGTRLWPISRTLYPKQFVKLFNDKSLFQSTLNRNLKVCNKSMIVVNQEQYFLALDQLEELDTQHSTQNTKFLLEPEGRNTAPAIALACMTLPKDEIVLVTPSDHLIKNETKYQEVIKLAQNEAKKDNLVTFGTTPTHPETGFGYIEANGLDVVKFHEKPDLETAQSYIQTNNQSTNTQVTNNQPTTRYYWNSGMFMFKAGVFLEELQNHSPKIYEECKKVYTNNVKPITTNQLRITNMQNIPSDSIDYAVMEKSKKVKVIPSDIEWSDVGSFDALYEEMPKDANNNTINDNHISIDSKDNLVYGDERVVATVDVKDLIIVDTADALLISKKGSSQKVKQVVTKLKEQNSTLHNIHLTAHRPWGTYTVLEDTPGYKIKKIVVQPGKRLSLQKHFHRNEHWIVVSGTATVTVEDKKYYVRPNESTYIKMGEIHRLENQGKIPVVLIEAQVGEYTGEDDIVRIEDDFKRESN